MLVNTLGPWTMTILFNIRLLTKILVTSALRLLHIACIRFKLQNRALVVMNDSNYHDPDRSKMLHWDRFNRKSECIYVFLILAYNANVTAPKQPTDLRSPIQSTAGIHQFSNFSVKYCRQGRITAVLDHAEPVNVIWRRATWPDDLTWPQPFPFIVRN